MAESADHFDFGPGKLSITDHELFERLTWFTYVRWGFGALCLVILLVAWYGFGMRFCAAGRTASMAPVIRVILLIFLYNAFFTFLNPILRARQRITRRLIVLIALTQILCDVVAILALVHLTGGLENPFIVLILVPLAIVAELLPCGLAYGTAAAAVILLNAVAWGEQQGWINHVHIERADGTPLQVSGSYADAYYVLADVSALSVGLFMMVFVTQTIAGRLRNREDQLGAAYQTLRSTDEAKSFFMRRAEHEMRAPLAAIQSLLDAMLTGQEPLSVAQQDVIARAKRRTAALMEFVRDLRRYSWFRRPDRIFDIERFDLAAVASNTIDLFASQASGQELTLNGAIEPVQMEGNEEMLRELVTNLVANAVQYTPAGGHIDVTLRIDGQTAEFVVVDTGIGMTPETRDRLFEEFYRAPEAKEVFRDGTGLGMAIVGRIVQIHRGRIDVADNPGGGTVMRVRLPLQHRREGGR